MPSLPCQPWRRPPSPARALAPRCSLPACRRCRPRPRRAPGSHLDPTSPLAWCARSRGTSPQPRSRTTRATTLATSRCAQPPPFACLRLTHSAKVSPHSRQAHPVQDPGLPPHREMARSLPAPLLPKKLRSQAHSRGTANPGCVGSPTCAAWVASARVPCGCTDGNRARGAWSCAHCKLQAARASQPPAQRSLAASC